MRAASRFACLRLGSLSVPVRRTTTEPSATSALSGTSTSLIAHVSFLDLSKVILDYLPDQVQDDEIRISSALVLNPGVKKV